MTKGGLFKTYDICPIKFYLPEFSTQECIKWKFHIDNLQYADFKEAQKDII